MIEREIWLIQMASVSKRHFEFPSPTEEKIFILHYLGVNVEVRLWSKAISANLKEIPYKHSWVYLGMNPNSIEGADEEELKAITKEAIQTYKQLGICGRRTDVTEITFIDSEGAE